MFDKDIVMLQVTMYTSLHFFKYFQDVFVFMFIFIRTFLKKKSLFFVEGLPFSYFIYIIME